MSGMKSGTAGLIHAVVPLRGTIRAVDEKMWLSVAGAGRHGRHISTGHRGEIGNGSGIRDVFPKIGRVDMAAIVDYPGHSSTYGREIIRRPVCMDRAARGC